MIYYGKKYGSKPKTMVMALWFTVDKVCGTKEKNYGTIPKIMELWFGMENIYYYGKTLWYYTENHVTLICYGKYILLWKNTMVLYRKPWNFDLLWKIYITMEKHYGTIPKTMELWFSMENIYYYGKNFGTILKIMELWFAMEII